MSVRRIRHMRIAASEAKKTLEKLTAFQDPTMHHRPFFQILQNHKNLNEAKEINSEESSGRDGERPTKAASFLIKVVWFFILWGTLHWLFS